MYRGCNTTSSISLILLLLYLSFDLDTVTKASANVHTALVVKDADNFVNDLYADTRLDKTNAAPSALSSETEQVPSELSLSPVSTFVP